MSVRMRRMTRTQVVRNPTKDYVPQGGADGWYGFPSALLDNAPVFTWMDVPRMMRDERVQFGLRMLKAPFQQVKFKVKADDRAVALFAFETVKKFWNRFVGRILSRYFKWGCCPVGLEYEIERGKAVLHFCRIVEPMDAKPLEYKGGHDRGQFGGFSFADKRVTRPHAMWFCGEGDLDKYHDRPRLAGAFEPWLEKKGRTGAVHSRRLAARTVAFRRPGIRHPTGDVNIATDLEPVMVHGQVLARQVAEAIETGSIPLLPNNPNPGMPTEYNWDLLEAPPSQNLDGVMQYPKDLNKEIDTGLGIPTEVIEASEVGSGWSGRMIPARAFYGSLDEVVGNLIDCFDRDCLRYLVALNFGDARYEVEAKPLADVVFGTEANPGGEGQQGQPGRQPGEASQPKPPGHTARPSVGQRPAMTTNSTTRSSVGKAKVGGNELSWGSRGAAIAKAFDAGRDVEVVELTRADLSWEESKHPRGQPENAGEFGPGGGGRKKTPAKKSAKTVTGDEEEESPSKSEAPKTKLQAWAASHVGGKVKAVFQRAFTGESAPTETKISKQLAGAIGEEVVIAVLKSRGHKDAGSLSAYMHSERNNLPADLIHDHRIIEVKTGQASNGPDARKWRLTIGEPGEKEKAWLAKASPAEKAAHNEKKMVLIHERKKAELAKVAKQLGYKIAGKTMTVIINPATQIADVYEFDGFHNLIGWNSEAAQKAYAGSYRYGGKS